VNNHIPLREQSMAVPVGTFGEILEGDERGRFVVVQDDRERSGGYLTYWEVVGA
jgi:hypothetical protein